MYIPAFSFHYPAPKTYYTSLLGIIAMSCVVGTAASCSDRRREPDPTIKSVEVNPAPASNPVPERTLPPERLAVSPVVSDNTPAATDPFADASSALDHATREQASSLTPIPENLNRNIDSSVAAWKAKGGSSTTMSENKLELARTDFAQKIRALTLADAETWKNAKADAQSSLENLRRVYEGLLSGHDQA